MMSKQITRSGTPLEILRARCEAAGLYWPNFITAIDAMLSDLKKVVPPILETEKEVKRNPEFDKLLCAATHALLDWYERRDWVECPGGLEYLCVRGLAMTGKNVIKGSCMKCLQYGGQGRVPPEAKGGGDV